MVTNNYFAIFPRKKFQPTTFIKNILPQSVLRYFNYEFSKVLEVRVIKSVSKNKLEIPFMIEE